MLCLNHTVLVRIVCEEGVLNEIGHVLRFRHHLKNITGGANLIEHDEVGRKHICHLLGDHVDVTSFSEE